MHALESEANTCRLSLQVQFREKLTVCDQPMCIILSCLVMEKSTLKYALIFSISFSRTFLIHNFWKGIYSYHVQFETKQYLITKALLLELMWEKIHRKRKMSREWFFFRLRDGDFCEYLDSFERV